MERRLVGWYTEPLSHISRISFFLAIRCSSVGLFAVRGGVRSGSMMMGYTMAGLGYRASMVWSERVCGIRICIELQEQSYYMGTKVVVFVVLLSNVILKFPRQTPCTIMYTILGSNSNSSGYGVHARELCEGLKGCVSNVSNTRGSGKDLQRQH